MANKPPKRGERSGTDSSLPSSKGALPAVFLSCTSSLQNCDYGTLWVKGLWISTLLYTSAFTEGYSQLLTDKMIFRKTLQDLISNSSVVFHHRVFPICLISIHFTFMVNYSITLGG